MGSGISDADRADVERLAVLNSHRATMLVGAPWKKLLRRHGFGNEHEYLALMSQLVRRFAAEPALAEAFAQRNEAETAARMREAAVAKGVAAERFARAGVRLVVLDIASDSFPLAFHAVSDDAQVHELAERCARAGFGTLRRAQDHTD